MILKFQCLLLLTITATVANCGLLGHISYAGGPMLNHFHQYPRQAYSDASKVSYSSLNQPIYNLPPVQYTRPQQVSYGLNSYAPYQSPAGLYQQNYQSVAAAPAPAYYAQQQSYQAPQYTQNFQYPNHHQFTVAHQQAAPVNYGSSYPATALGDATYQQQVYNQQPYAQQYVQQSVQTYQPIQQSVAVQGYQQQQQQQQVQVQPLQQPLTPQAALPVQKPVTVQQFPAPAPIQPTVTYHNHLPATPTTATKNAHHYPNTIPHAAANVAHQPVVQQLQAPHTVFSTSPKTGNSVFRTSFSVGAKQSSSQQIIGASAAPVQQSQQVFRSAVHSTGATLTNNPINIPSSTLVAPVSATGGASAQKSVIQQSSYNAPQQVKSFSPSTAVSHAKFTGMGVSYEW